GRRSSRCFGNALRARSTPFCVRRGFFPSPPRRLLVRTAGPIRTFSRCRWRRPPPPKQRRPADAVRKTGKCFVADPGYAPDYVLSSGCIVAGAQALRASNISPQLLREILNV